MVGTAMLWMGGRQGIWRRRSSATTAKVDPAEYWACFWLKGTEREGVGAERHRNLLGKQVLGDKRAMAVAEGPTEEKG